jgi:hypothetical protein
MVNSFVSDGNTAGDIAVSGSQNLLENKETSERVNIVIAPAQVNDVVHNGHFGDYVADVLMEQMLMCDKVRLLDRSVSNAQIDEINLAGDILDPATTIQRGKGIGARYILQTTMQKPDVANVRTGISNGCGTRADGSEYRRGLRIEYEFCYIESIGQFVRPCGGFADGRNCVYVFGQWKGTRQISIIHGVWRFRRR